MVNCTNCQYPNEDTARFCQNCGQILKQVCPNCATPNDSSALFCKNCGNALSEAAEKPQPVLPASTRTPAPQKTLLSGRRVVTIMFADVKGSTTLAEKLDPEEWTEIMNGTF